MYMGWHVFISSQARKSIRALPGAVSELAELLVEEIKISGPIRDSWPNYGKLKGKVECHHCHLKKGRPTYVAVWQVTGEREVIIRYVGTHEKADYDRRCRTGRRGA